jgi:predicted dehydrogenase
MSDNIANKKILLIGSGPMSQAYAKVLIDMKVDFEVIGRGLHSAEEFEKQVGIKPFVGGVEKFISLHSASAFSKAIVATGTEGLKDITQQLVKWGIGEILVEKPGGKSIEEVLELDQFVELYNAKVFIAYNRRFYAAVKQLQKIISEDGGVTSFNFEFTEWSHIIEPLKKASGVKENWFFANSTHVVDTAFYLGGKPVTMASYAKGELSWHPVSIFAGAGISDKGALFSYHANWKAPGRWSVEILTEKRRLYLKPMEKLQVQQIGSVEVKFLELDDNLDTQYKPGIYLQTAAFITESGSLVSLKEHIEHCTFYQRMLSEGSI